MAPEVSEARRLVAEYQSSRKIEIDCQSLTRESFHEIIDELRKWFDSNSPVAMEHFLNFDFETKRARGITRDQVPYFRETFISSCVRAVAELLEKNATPPVPRKKR